MIWVYRTLMTLLAPLAIVGLVIRGFKNPAYWRRWPERFGHVPTKVANLAPYDLWIHAHLELAAQYYAHQSML